MNPNYKVFTLALFFFLVACSSSKKTGTGAANAATAAVADADHDGSSFEKAIVAKSVSDEYAYVRQVCPECKFKGQSLKSQGKKFYDVLTFDKSGTEVLYYFDINRFFGKGFN